MSYVIKKGDYEVKVTAVVEQKPYASSQHLPIMCIRFKFLCLSFSKVKMILNSEYCVSTPDVKVSFNMD